MNDQHLPCPVCGAPMALRLAKSRKAKRPKVFLMLVCLEDGRHFRGFIQDREYVNRVVNQIEASDSVRDGGDASV